jgi:hypothetical protein
VPTPIIPTPALHSSGTVYLFANWDEELNGSLTLDEPENYLDLDRGVVGDMVGGDIRLAATAGSDTFFYLDPVNGARTASVGVDEPSFDECKRIDSFTRSSIPQFFLGNHLCVLTSERRLGQLRMGDFVSGEPSRLEISFVTWEKETR